MCEMQGEIPQLVAELIARIDPAHLESRYDDIDNRDILYLSKDGVDALLERVTDCPACALAVIRQGGFAAVDFHYGASKAAFWAEIDHQAKLDEYRQMGYE